MGQKAGFCDYLLIIRRVHIDNALAMAVNEQFAFRGRWPMPTLTDKRPGRKRQPPAAQPSLVRRSPAGVIEHLGSYMKTRKVTRGSAIRWGIPAAGRWGAWGQVALAEGGQSRIFQ
jgi:hypothetical protein